MIKFVLQPLGKLIAHYLNQPTRNDYVPATIKSALDLVSALSDPVRR